VNQLVRVYVAQKRKISEGDKLAGRHGNKGVISRSSPSRHAVPRRRNAVDIVLNPLGVPSRMNVGQMLESHRLRSARLDRREQRPAERTSGAARAAVWIASPVFDGAHWDEAEDAARRHDPDAVREPEPRRGRRSGHPRRQAHHDGRTGEPYDRPVTVSCMYILKLSHLVDDKIRAFDGPVLDDHAAAARREGAVQRPALRGDGVGARGVRRRVRLGDPTIKSDDVLGRVKVYEAIVKGDNIPEPGIPESFKVLIKEMQALCLNVRVMNAAGEEVEIRELDEDAFRTTESLGIDLSRPERGTDEDDAATAAARSNF
jgi:DNA-directed RNA polymerase subunit beta